MPSARANDRRQLIALAFVLLLGGAEAARLNDEVHLRLSMEANMAKSVTKKESSAAVVSQNQAMVDTRADLETRLTTLNETTTRITKGGGWFGVKHCLTMCPVLWVEVLYSQWKAKSSAQALVAESFTGSGDINKLKTVNAPLAESFRNTMRQTVWTFLQALDNSMFQRIILTLLLAPLAAFRAVVGIAPLGLCFLKSAWADMEMFTPYRQKSTKWWSMMLAGCPSVEEAVPAAVEDTSKTERFLNGMVFTLGKANGLSSAQDEEAANAKWASAPGPFSQCVLKKSRRGKWQHRLLSIEKGIISWKSATKCKASAFDRAKAWFGKSQSFAMQFLTAAPGHDPVELADRGGGVAQCVTLQNPYRKFEFCAYEEGETMSSAKRVIDAHLELLRDERELMATTAKLERLLAAGGEDDEAAEVAKVIDGTGDANVADLANKMGGQHVTGEGDEATKANQILDKIRTGSSLLQAGEDVEAGTLMVQEAFAQAHSNAKLQAVMNGTESASAGLIGESATGAGGLSMTELIIILFVCGGGILCLGLPLVLARSSLVEEEDKADEGKKVQAPRFPLLSVINASAALA